MEIESLRIMLATNTLIIKVSIVNPTPHCTYWMSCTCVCVLFTVHIPLYQNTTLISSLITVAPWVIIFTHVVIYNSISVDFSPPPMLGFYVEYSDCHSNRLQLFLFILWELIAMNTGTVASKHICANYWRCVCKSGRCHTTVKANILTYSIHCVTYLYVHVGHIIIYSHTLLYTTVSVFMCGSYTSA